MVELRIRLNSAQFQLKLPVGAELGNSNKSQAPSPSLSLSILKNNIAKKQVKLDKVSPVFVVLEINNSVKKRRIKILVVSFIQPT